MWTTVAWLLALAQEPEPAPRQADESRDRILEITPDDPVLEGHGPSQRFELAVDFSGVLYIWTEGAACDPFVRVEDRAGALLAEDDDGGGGRTSFVQLVVSPGREFVVHVACAEAREPSTVRVVVADARDSPAARRAAERALTDLAEAEAALAQDGSDQFRARLDAAVRRLLDAPGARESVPALEALWRLAQRAHSIGALTTSLAAYEALLEHIERRRPEAHPQLQVARHNTALMLTELGALDRANELHERVLAVRQRDLPEAHPQLQASRRALGRTLRELGQLDRALALQQLVLDTSAGAVPDDDLDVLATRMELAATQLLRGRAQIARELMEQVLAAYSGVLPADDSRVLNARNNLANIYRELGRTREAKALQEQVVDALASTLSSDALDLLTARETLALIYEELGDLTSARELIAAVLEARSRVLPDDHAALQTARHNLARLMTDMGELAPARELAERVLATYSRTLPSDHALVQRARAGLARTLLRLGDLPAARELSEHALASLERTHPEDAPEVLLARDNLASVLRRQGDLEVARKLQARSLELLARELPAEHYDLLLARENLALTLDESGERAQVAVQVAAMIGGLRESLSRAVASSAPREVEAYAVDVMPRLSTALALLDGAGRVEPLRGLEGDAFALIESLRGVGLASARCWRSSEVDAGLRELRERVRRASELVTEIAGSADARAELGSAVRARDRAQRALLERLAEHDDARGGVAVPAAPILAARLADGDAAVGYWRYTAGSGEQTTDRMLAFVLRSDGALARVELGSLSAIAEAVASWRASVGSRGIGSARRGVVVEASAADPERESGERLRALVFDPLRPALGGAARLHVACDDVLHGVAIDALPMENARVGDSFAIHVRLSLSELFLESADSPDELALLAVGAVDYDAQAQPGGSPSASSREFATLPASGPEAESIAALGRSSAKVRATVLTGADARKEKLAQLAESTRYLHFATHGFFARDGLPQLSAARPGDRRPGVGTFATRGGQIDRMSPMALCGLALSGANAPRDAAGRRAGVVTAEELSAWNLSSCELAVLSACDTNVGLHDAGQGVASLQKALHMAGARSVITSLWPVPDETTKELMLDFYRRLWVERTPKWRALWEAKVKLRDARDERGQPVHSTRDWAAWVLTGEPE